MKTHKGKHVVTPFSVLQEKKKKTVCNPEEGHESNFNTPSSPS